MGVNFFSAKLDTKGGGSEGFVSVATKFTCFHFWIFPLNALKLLQNKRLCQFCCCAQHSCKKWGLINWIAPFIFIIENILKPLLAKFWYLIEFEITIRLLNNFSRNLASSKFLKNPPKRSKLCLPHSRHPTLACSPPEQGEKEAQAYFIMDTVSNERPISSFENRTRILLFQSLILRREQEFWIHASCFETRIFHLISDFETRTRYKIKIILPTIFDNDIFCLSLDWYFQKRLLISKFS